MIAKVIVDVPAKQTNRTFDYEIPENLVPWVEIGCRVAVSFGTRFLQGIVIDIQMHSEYGTKIKEIDDVLDVIPTFTKELVELATWMSKEYFSPEILSLQAMIPKALKSEYDRIIKQGYVKIQSSDHHALKMQEIIEFVSTHSKVSLQMIHKRFPEKVNLIKEMVEREILITEQTIKDSLAKKKVKVIRILYTTSQIINLIQSLSQKAIKQKAVLQYFIEHQHSIDHSELLKKFRISSVTIKSLIDKGVIELKEIEFQRDPYANHTFVSTTPKNLTLDQQRAFDRIQHHIKIAQYKTFLLHGVTGSGKTEIYLQAMQSCLLQNKKAILLVPEISLTPQMVQRFKERFGKKVAVWHSRLSAGERYDEWRKMRNQQVDIVVGARSAVFAPFLHIGLIIIDEEHEATYKQEETPKYHAKSIAIKRAQSHQATLILGSATPSLESIQATRDTSMHFPKIKEPYELLSLDHRIENRPLPTVQIVDMRDELKAGNRTMFSRSLYESIHNRLNKQEQMILLLNRRGYATFVMCRSCSYVCSCPHCEISMTFHQNNQTLRCHYCGFSENMVTSCPDCSSKYIRQFGTGTQRIQEELSRLFPGIRTIRMDIDTTAEKGSHEKWLSQFERGEADVLLGTQMVAKGLDFPEVTLVGVLAADSSLNFPDFRAQERTFQLLTQVAGRAGRHHKLGEVIIQSYIPEHPIILASSQHDYLTFAQQELDIRAKLMYPPYRRLIAITCSHEQPPFLLSITQAFVSKLKEFFQLHVGNEYIVADVLGPVASPIARIKDRYRFQCMIKYEGSEATNMYVLDAISQTINFFEDQITKQKLHISVDVDPQYMM